MILFNQLFWFVQTPVCLTEGCNWSFLQQKSRPQDIPWVTLIRGTDIYHNVQLLARQCNNCETIYYADHECTSAAEGTEAMKFFLNSAHCLKVGQKLWVNHPFSIEVLNAMYDLHASASGWMKFFNDTYVLRPGPNGSKLPKMSLEWAGTWPQLMCCASVLSLSLICRETKEGV